MATKEDWIELFDFIRTSFFSEGYRPDFVFPDSINKHFNIDLRMERIEKCPVPLLTFEIKHKETNKAVKMLFGASSLLFSVNFGDFRTKVIEDNFSGIVTTKQHFFKSTGATFAFIIFTEGKDKTYFSSVESSLDLYNVIFDRKNSNLQIFYPASIDPVNLTPEHYSDKNLYLKTFINNFETKKLSEIAEVFNGANIPKTEIKDSGIPVLYVKHIKDGVINHSKTYVCSDMCEKYAKAILQEGDILISKFFDQKKIVFVTENDLPAIASSMFAIIRPFSVSEKRLYTYLSSNAGKVVFGEQLSSITHGSAIPSVNITDLRNLDIPAFDAAFFAEYISKNENSRKPILHFFENNTATIKKEKIFDYFFKNTIKEELTASGWAENDVVFDYRFYTREGCLVVDYVLCDSGIPLACMENHITEERKNNLLAILKENKQQKSIFLIIHNESGFTVIQKLSNTEKEFSFTHFPRKEELLNILEKGAEVE